MRKFIPDSAKLIPKDAKMVFSGELFDVYQWPQKMYDGSTATFEMLRRQDTVKIIAVKRNKIVIVRQKQPTKDNWYYDFPGGRVDEEDEDELAAAKREMLEETGMVFGSWKLLKVVQPFARMDWLVYTFLATEFEGQTEQKLDGGEMIEVEEVSFDEMVEMIKKSDAKDMRVDWDSLGVVQTLDELVKTPEIYKYC